MQQVQQRAQKQHARRKDMVQVSNERFVLEGSIGRVVLGAVQNVEINRKERRRKRVVQ